MKENKRGFDKFCLNNILFLFVFREIILIAYLLHQCIRLYFMIAFLTCNCLDDIHSYIRALLECRPSNFTFSRCED